MSNEPTRELYLQRKALADELVQALGDDAPRKSLAWWHYFFIAAELGPERARQLVQDARAVEAQGGMATVDGTRRRTLGGIFFVLAKAQVGPRKARSLRWRARQRFEELAIRNARATAPSPAIDEALRGPLKRSTPVSE